MFQGLTRDIAEEAVWLLEPTFALLLGSSVTDPEDTGFYIIILAPRTGEILYEGVIGHGAGEYREIAFAKAKLAFETGMTGSAMQSQAPWNYRPGDVRYVGGVIENGLAIGVSGLRAHYDEMVAWWLLSTIGAFCTNEIKQIPKEAPAFLPVLAVNHGSEEENAS